MRKLLIVLAFCLGNCFNISAQTGDEVIAEIARLFNKNDLETPIDNERFFILPTGTFAHGQIMDIPESNQSDLLHKVLIIVDSTLYSELFFDIDRYAHDIHYVYGCNIIMEWVNNETCQDVKNIILNYQSHLDGCVFVGDIATAWYEADDYAADSTKKNWPCDTYYMDLTGTWTDVDQNGSFDLYYGDSIPEIFVGRISTADMGNLVGEIEGMHLYLKKNHRYWIGHRRVNKKNGLAYTNSPWQLDHTFLDSISYLYGPNNYDSYRPLTDTSFGKTDYLQKLCDDKYEFVQLASHSNFDHHEQFGPTNSWISGNTIFSNGTNVLGFNLFCCYACRWTSATNTNAFLAGDYIYSPKSDGLCVIGFTKAGGLYPYRNFYTSLQNERTMGQALVDWWHQRIPYQGSLLDLCWTFGLSIIGDPLVNFYHCTNGSCKEQITLNSYNYANSPLSYYLASEKITIPSTASYIIPVGDHCILNAPTVEIQGEFLCPRGSSMEVLNEGCKPNCDE